VSECTCFRATYFREIRMSSMFLWGGLTCIVALGPLGVPFMGIIGAILMVVGLVLLILGR
jgi:hypothetical protein